MYDLIVSLNWGSYPLNPQLPNSSIRNILALPTSKLLKSWPTLEKIIFGSTISGTSPFMELGSVRMGVQRKHSLLIADHLDYGELQPGRVLATFNTRGQQFASEGDKNLRRSSGSSHCFSTMYLCASICIKTLCVDKFWTTNLHWHKRISTYVYLKMLLSWQFRQIPFRQRYK